MAALAGRTIISLACAFYPDKLSQPERAEVVVMDRYLLSRIWLGIGADVALTGVVGLRATANCRLLAWSDLEKDLNPSGSTN